MVYGSCIHSFNHSTTFGLVLCWVLDMQKWVTCSLLSRGSQFSWGGGEIQMHMKVTVMLCDKWNIQEMEKSSEHQTERHSNISAREIKRPTKKMTITLVLEEWICFLPKEKVRDKRSLSSAWAKAGGVRVYGVWDIVTWHHVKSATNNIYAHLFWSL